MLSSRISYLFVPIVVISLFHGVLLDTDRLAFRDVGHFYTPLYDYVAQRTSDEWIPLWNPLCQTGLPLMGETTTAVLYPLRYAVFSLPTSTTQAIGLYVVLHLILASFTASWATIHAGASRRLAPIAGILYSLSGGVFFLYSNPPFLVGAAWLPMLFGTILSGDSISTRNRILIAGVAMAMMILGGDPQTVLHGLLVASGLVMCRIAFKRRFVGGANSSSVRTTCTVIIASSALAIALSAPQIAASISWSRHSERVLAQDDAQWLSPPIAGTQRSDAYQFSLPPWHVLEILTPNAWGNLFPKHQRISQAIPGDGRMWAPTIYVGMLAALALTARITRWRREGLDRWSVIAVITFLLSMGHFGAAWMIQQIPGVLPNVDSAIGGPYWWLREFLPGYSSFRYPVKWLPVFSLATAILSVRWLERQLSLPASLRRIAKASGVTVVVLLVGMTSVVGLAILQPQWLFGIQRGADEYWGPIDFAGGLRAIGYSYLHSIFVMVALLTILHRLCRTESDATQHPRFPAFLLAGLLAIDLAITMHPTLATLNKSREQTQLTQAQDVLPGNRHTLWMRTVSTDRFPPDKWLLTQSDDRMQQVGFMERSTKFGRWHMPDHQKKFNSMVSIRSRDMVEFWNAAGTASRKHGDNKQFWQFVREWLGEAKPQSNDTWRSRNRAEIDFPALLNNVVSDRGRPSPTLLTTSVAEPTVTREHRPPVELSDAGEPNASREHRDTDTRKVSVCLSHDPTKRDHTFESDFDHLVAEPVYQDGHWIAHLTNLESSQTHTATVHQVDFIKQGVVVPKGKWRVQFVYSPWWFVPSVLTAIVAWSACVILAVRILRQRRSHG